MTQETHTHGAPEQTVFSQEEWQELQADDRAAAKAIIYLLLGIFATGLVLYSIVAWTF